MIFEHHGATTVGEEVCRCRGGFDNSAFRGKRTVEYCQAALRVERGIETTDEVVVVAHRPGETVAETPACDRECVKMQ
jgi:hypothetical protein